MPLPSKEWTDTTRNADLLRPRPSSPCTTHGAHLAKQSSPCLAFSKTGCWGYCTSYKDQNISRIFSSLSQSGRCKPHNICQWFSRTRNDAQSLRDNMGRLYLSCTRMWDLGIGNPKPNWFTIILWQSRSEFFSDRLANFESPGDFAKAFSPTSLRRFRAVRIADAHEALARQTHAGISWLFFWW